VTILDARALPSIERNAPLGPQTWFGVGGAAEILARPRSPEELAALVERSHGEGKRLRVLGAGSNVLVADSGVKGVVVLLSAPPFKSLVRKDETTVQVGAGSRLSRLVSAAEDWALSGAEGLAGIPGTVGGALRMNSGTPVGEIGPLVRRVWALSAEGRALTLSGPDCSFSYRSSSLGDKVILGAELSFVRGDPAEIRRRTESLFSHRAETQPPAASRHAGCVFKNPPGIAAGRLLDELGLKGRSVGGARVSEVHANFIEVREGAKAADVKALIDEMRRAAREEKGVELELQLDLWGFDED